MQSILVVVGIAVAVLGAFVLLRFPDRPGGRIAWRLDYLAQSESFRVDDVVDPDCDPVDDYPGSKANADVLQTYDDLSIDVGGRRYELNVNGGSDIRVRLARG